MKKIRQISLAIGVLALAFSFVGVNPASAALTLGALAVTSDGALSLAGAAASAITVGDAAQTGTVNVGVSTAAMTLNLGTGNGAKTVAVGTGTGIDTINIGTGGTATDVIAIGDSVASVALTDAQWSVTSPGVATFVNTLVSPSATTGVDVSSAGALSLGNVTATSVSVCNTAVCDTITIGSNADADTITIGDSTDTTVSITDDNWSITAAGVGTLVNALVSPSATTGVDTGSAGALSLGNVTATSVSVCNSAACDTLSLGTNADADTINIGDALDTVNLVAATLNTTGGAFDIAAAGAVTIGNTTATSVSVCNSAACDTITIGSNADADTITIGDATDTAVSITDDNWSVTTAGIGTLVNLLVSPSATTGVDVSSAGALSLGNVTATSVSVCNTAACDTITIGTNADDDTITIGEATDTNVSIVDNNWSVTTAGAATFVSTAIGGGTTLTKVTVGNLADGASGWVPDGAATSFTVTADAASVGANSLISVSVGANATAAACGVSTRTAATSFLVACSAAPANAATLQYMIVN